MPRSLASHIPVNALRYSSPGPLFINNTKVLSTPMRHHIALSLLVFKSMRFRCHRQRIDRLVSTLKRSKTMEFASCQWRRLNSIYENTRVWDIFNRRFHSAASGRFRIRCKVFLQLKLLYQFKFNGCAFNSPKGCCSVIAEYDQSNIFKVNL